VDAKQANGRLALAESNLLTELSNLHDVSARYVRLVGEVPAAKLASFPAKFTLPHLPTSVVEAMNQAASRNPALNAAIENVRASRAAIDSRKAAFGPRVDLRLSQSQDHNLLGALGQTRQSVVELLLTYNLYRGGADEARMTQAAEALNQALDLQDKACRDMRQTLSIAFNDMLRLNEQLGYLDQHRLSTDKAREAYRQQFDIGQRSLLDMLDTQNEYFESSRAYVNAQYNQITAQARTLAGIGRLMPAMDINRADMAEEAERNPARSEADANEVCGAIAPMPPLVDKAQLAADMPIRTRNTPLPAAK
jgi:adhesin transport system outer membrane protein